jgi:hypothetical protein
MSESAEREREIAQSAIAEVLKKHKANGHSLGAISEAMFAIGGRGMAGLFGGERAGAIGQRILESESLRSQAGVLNLADPSAEDYRQFTAAALNGAPPTFDRSELAASFVMHGALTAGGIDGAFPVLALLRQIADGINQMVADRTMRSGDPKDAN